MLLSPERRPALQRALAASLRSPVFLFLLYLGLGLPGTAAAKGGSVMVSSSGGGSFSLTAMNVSDVKGWSISISYDPATLNSPSVSVTSLLRKGSLSVDTSSAGAISVTASSLKPQNYSGNLLHLRFGVPGDVPGKITSAEIFVTRGNGAFEPLAVTILNPAEPQKTAADGADAPAESVPGVAGAATAGSTSQGDSSAGKPRAKEELISPSGKSGAILVQEGRGGAAGVPPEIKAVSSRLPSVLERFRELSSFADEDALRAIFRSHRDAVFSQEPGAALSDGSGSVVVSVRLEDAGDAIPLFLLRGAHFVGFKRSDRRFWQLEVVPHPGVSEAGLSVYYNRRVSEFPIAVAPSLEQHLKSRVGDPEWDYLDYYIYIANSLVRSP